MVAGIKEATPADLYAHDLYAHVQVSDESKGMYKASFKAQHTGVYQVHVLADGTPIKGSPFRSEVSSGRPDFTKCKLGGPGLEAVRLGQPCDLLIELFDTFSNKITSALDALADIQVQSTLDKSSSDKSKSSTKPKLVWNLFGTCLELFFIIFTHFIIFTRILFDKLKTCEVGLAQVLWLVEGRLYACANRNCTTLAVLCTEHLSECSHFSQLAKQDNVCTGRAGRHLGTCPRVCREWDLAIDYMYSWTRPAPPVVTPGQVRL